TNVERSRNRCDATPTITPTNGDDKAPAPIPTLIRRSRRSHAISAQPRPDNADSATTADQLRSRGSRIQRPSDATEITQVEKQNLRRVAAPPALAIIWGRW